MPSETARRKEGRIAIIDDDAVFVELMRDVLAEGEGYEVLTAPNWLHSVEFVKESRPDLIILDLMLGPQQSGWNVLELLREEPSLAQIPVIMCSAAEPALHRRPDTGHGAIEAVAKPFDLDYLLDVVERLIARN